MAAYVAAHQARAILDRIDRLEHRRSQDFSYEGELPHAELEPFTNRLDLPRPEGS